MRLIIAADLHLRDDRPRCRLDDDWEFTQTAALRQIVQYANEYDAYLCIVGDVFHKSKVPPWVEGLFLRYMGKVKKNVYVIAGNHDLPNHCWDKVDESSFGVIWHSLNIEPLWNIGQAAHFGESLEGENTGMLFLHTLVFPLAKDIPPNTEARTAAELVEEYPTSKWIFTGDNHHGFHYVNSKKHHVINPGSMLRQAADFKDYKPRVYFVDTDTEEVTECFINDSALLVTDAYLRSEHDRTDRIDAFVESVKTSGPVSLDFTSNLENDLSKLDPDTREMVYTLIEEANHEG
jgi:DNA repair exonuclease SbcCD nuclease subunit